MYYSSLIVVLHFVAKQGLCGAIHVVTKYKLGTASMQLQVYTRVGGLITEAEPRLLLHHP